MKNIPNSYCCRCKKAVYVEGTDVHGGAPCPYCGVSIADTGISWNCLRNGFKVKQKDGTPLPEIPEEGKIYEISGFGIG